MVLVRSRERVSDLGEVFTPEHIVKEMHDLLPPEKWAERDMVYLEPTCGNGQFLVQAVRMKMDSGLTPEQAVNTVFGLDIMQDNIEESRKRVLEVVLERLKRQKKGKQGKRLERMACMIVNNIIRVKDSLDYIAREGRFTSLWDEKPFFDSDPTGNKMVLPKYERRGVEAKAKEMVRKVGN